MNTFTKTALAAGLALTLGVSVSQANTAEAPALTVNGQPISQRLVDTVVTQQARGQAPTPELVAHIKDLLATQEAVSQEARRLGLDRTPETASQLEGARLGILSRAYVQKILAENPVSEAQIKAEYDRAVAGLTGNEYKVAHILVKSEKEAQDILAVLKKDKAAFTRLAQSKSQDPGTKAKGGNLDWMNPARLVPEFADAMIKLGKGQLSEKPVKTQYGWHIVRVDDVRRQQPPALEAVQDEIRAQLQQKIVDQKIDALRAQARIVPALK